MADYAISNVARRVVYANTGVGPYAFTFEILANTDIAVYRGSTLLTLTTDYSVTINVNGTGSVTLVTAGTGNITIVGARAIQRTSDYTTGGDLFASTLNTDLDSQTIYVQQVAETAERGLKAPVVDPTDINMTLPSKTARAGTFLAFDSPSGNPIAGPSIASVGTVTQNIANINTVATNIANVNTVAGISANVTTVAGISGNVTTVANNNANVTTVATDLAGADNIGTVAGSIANVNAVGSNIANVIAVDANETNINTVATDLAGADNIGTVAGSIADINALGPIAADIATVAGIDSDVTAVAADATDIGTVAGIAANVTTVAGISANVTSVAGNSTNINTVATNIANVNSVGTNIANVNSVAGNATNINAVVSNATNINTVAGISSNVTTVATNNANVTTVAGSIANVNTNATNIANINQNAANIVAIQNASANATAAANSATAAASSATSASASAAAASAVALGNEPVRHSVRPSLLLDFANTKTLDPRITFTRGSTGTFYDGKTVAKAEENLVQYSEQFDNAYWTKTNVTVTANSTTAPDGTTTAELIYPTTTGTNRYIGRNSVTGVSSTVYTISVFAKASGINFLYITTFGGSSIPAEMPFFDLQNGTVAQTGTFFTSASITSVGNGWYRCTATGATALASIFPYFGVADANNNGTATTSGTNGILLWGAQLEQRSSVTAYTATTTAPITNYIPALQTAASGVARFEHNPVTGESLGLEIEEQRTNLLTYSEQFDNAAWTKLNASIDANAVVSPDGTLTADKLIEDATTNSRYVNTATLTISNSTAYTMSFYAKDAGRRYVQAVFSSGFGGATNYVTFDLQSGVVGGSSTLVGTITSVGNGWYRCTATATSTNTTFIGYIGLSNASTGRLPSYTGDGYSGIYIWGAQLEAGAFATSYIKTEGATATRSADSASMTVPNFSSWYRADEWTLYGEAENRNGIVSSTNFHIALLISGSSASTAQIMRFRGDTNAIQSYGSNGSEANQWVLTNGSGVSKGSFGKGGLTYKANDVALSSGGTAVSTDAVAQIPELNTLQIGIGTSSAQSINGSIRKLAYYPKRLTNAELQSLTTI